MAVLELCNWRIFREGKPLLAIDTSDCGAVGLEPWVRRIAAESGQAVDWHYSRGRARVLYIGDREAILEAVAMIPCPGRIMHVFAEGEPGLCRNLA